jgi:hypothetical protein
MPSNFETTWTDIVRALDRGAIAQNWSIAKSYTGRTFKVEDVERTSITVSGGKMRAPRRVSRGEFEKLYEIWDAYPAGKYTRAEMRSQSQNTTYILSILHSLTDTQG